MNLGECRSRVVLGRSNQLPVFFLYLSSLEATHCFYIVHMAGNFVPVSRSFS